MTNWSSGYVADVGYTYGYYSELNPVRARLALLNAGLVCPEFGSACELGFGQGLSANIHAAASVCGWSGTDFNPAQAAFAQDLSKASGSGAKLFDEAFSEFAHRDLPDFDYIGLHGIWSWISDDNRAVIVDFIRRKLKVGGVLYISYNTLPGWGAFAPIRHLMTEHAEVIGAEGRGIVSRINDAIDFTERLLATNPLYARVNPQIKERIQKLKDQNRHYLAHEYFNRDWHPMHFATMAQWLEPAKLQYACSAGYIEHVDALNLSAEQQAFLNEIPDRMFRETVRDFMVNQQFRKDYWIKGARTMNALQRSQALQEQRVVLAAPADDVKLTAKGARGESKLVDTIYAPIIAKLSDHQPHKVQDLVRVLGDQDNPFHKALQALMVLTGQGCLHPAQAPEDITKATKSAHRLNHHIMTLSRGSADVNHLASPVTGGGVGVGRVPQLFLQSLGSGRRQQQEWVQDAWAILKSQGHRILKSGKPLQGEEETLAELAQMARDFQTKALPALQALKVI